MSEHNLPSPFTQLWCYLLRKEYEAPARQAATDNRIDIPRLLLFVGFHLACVAVFWVGVSGVALLFAALFYVVRMFFITAFYHRYFSHKTYSVSRGTQFLMAVACCSTGQRGPLWWAAHHRDHHLTSDTEKDPHAPKNGFLNSHMFWFLRKNHIHVNTRRIKDLTRFPELVWLEQLNVVPLIIYIGLCYALGVMLNNWNPALGTSGLQMMIWAGFISTVVLYHATYCINSLAHIFGSRRFETKDNSKNNLALALLTLGEGWHNNHHRYPSSTRQGFYPQEIDICYGILKVMSLCGLVKDMKPVPAAVLEEGRQ